MREGYPAKVTTVMTRGDLDNDSTVSVRCNGYTFDISLSPAYFTDSPKTTTLYLKYLKVLHPMGPGELEDIVEQDVFSWIIDTFEPIFEALAPSTLPSFDPKMIETLHARPNLAEYLFPTTFGCRLDAVNEQLIPRHVDNRGRFVPPRTYLDGDFLDELETWTTLYDPSSVEVAFSNPLHALDQMPSRVRIVDKDGVEKKCFYKGFQAGAPGGPLQRELQVYQKISLSSLASTAPLGRLMGVVHEDSSDATLGLLLNHIDCRGTLEDVVWDDSVTIQTKEKWAAQVEEAVAALHSAGAVWGDAKPANVLIDRDDNAWVTDFEGGYTEGWVDRDKAGTVEGDLQGLEKIKKHVVAEHRFTPDSSHSD